MECRGGEPSRLGLFLLFALPTGALLEISKRLLESSYMLGPAQVGALTSSLMALGGGGCTPFSASRMIWSAVSSS
ncbi:hypothetical protein AGDE_15231 [Angomonas deanei]|nr:hypothetical protein AGDE_15231 [Angomonas deanei]|eukprot:EPY19452.1 hypothetical protein AGDE_15231 [Angomonas deanei]